MGDAPEKFKSTVSLISHQTGTAGDHRPIDSDVAITVVSAQARIRPRGIHLTRA